MKNFSTPLLVIVSLAVLVFGTTSCVPVAVGAVGGYMLGKDGVRLQSPVTKDPPAQNYQY